MKTCTKCKKELPPIAFAINKTKPSGLSPHCKECHKRYSKQHYQENKTYYLCKAIKNNKKILLENKGKINELKSRKGCKYCEETDWACMDFHHPNDNKAFTISKRRTNSWETLYKEIEKCEVVCSNCHRKLHAGRRLMAR
jgi:hypothetical protein